MYSFLIALHHTSEKRLDDTDQLVRWLVEVERDPGMAHELAIDYGICPQSSRAIYDPDRAHGRGLRQVSRPGVGLGSLRCCA